MSNLLCTEAFSIDASTFGGNQMLAGGALIERIKDWLGKLGVPLPPKDEFLKTVAAAYDAYVAPIDIPGVPNLVEPWVDAALKSIVLNQASKIYDAIAKE